MMTLLGNLALVFTGAVRIRKTLQKPMHRTFDALLIERRLVLSWRTSARKVGCPVGDEAWDLAGIANRENSVSSLKNVARKSMKEAVILHECVIAQSLGSSLICT